MPSKRGGKHGRPTTIRTYSETQTQTPTFDVATFQAAVTAAMIAVMASINNIANGNGGTNSSSTRVKQRQTKRQQPMSLPSQRPMLLKPQLNNTWVFYPSATSATSITTELAVNSPATTATERATQPATAGNRSVSPRS